MGKVMTDSFLIHDYDGWMDEWQLSDIDFESFIDFLETGNKVSRWEGILS